MKRIAAIFIISILFLTGCGNHLNNITTVKDFTKSLVEGNISEALKHSSGSVYWKLRNLKSSIDGYKFIRENNQIEVLNNRYQIYHSAVEYEYKGLNDVVFYKIQLIDNHVYRIEEEEPYITGNASASKDNDKSIRDIFKYYITAIQNKNYLEGRKYLISIARKNHDNTQAYLKKSDLIKLGSDIKTENIITSGNISINKIAYENNGRRITVLASFYKTLQGWRIYDISQI